MADERRPLLNENPANSGYQPPDYTHSHQNSNDIQAPPTDGNVVNIPPIGVDELPPPYTPSAQDGNMVHDPMINCKVCQSIINIEGKMHQHVVKCTVCNEATPIKAAPPGKKYVRCPCNCLLICKGSSQRIACPRPNCKRIINMCPVESTVGMTLRTPGMSRVQCAHCGDTFLFNILNKCLARCPHCRRISSVGPSYARKRATGFLIAGLIMLAIAIGVTVGTLNAAEKSGGIYVVYIGGFAIGLVLLIRASYFAVMKVSHIEGPA